MPKNIEAYGELGKLIMRYENSLTLVNNVGGLESMAQMYGAKKELGNWLVDHIFHAKDFELKEL